MPRICSGQQVRLEARSADVIHDLLGFGFPRRQIEPSGWAVVSFPLGLRLESPQASVDECVVHVKIHVLTAGERQEKVQIIAPAPFPEE